MGDELPDDILRCIRRILRKTSEYSRQLARKTDLSVPQLMCLLAIEKAAQEDPDVVTAVMIGKQLNLSAPTVSRLIDRMEKSGFVSRERSTRDRRKVYLSLTDKGQKVLRQAPPLLHEQFLARLSGMSQRQQSQLLRSLQKVVDMMEASDVAADPVLMPGSEKA